MSIYFYGCISIDGYLADKNHGLEWLYQTGAVAETNYQQFYELMDITLMGNRTFAAIANLDDLDSVYKTTTNYVFTHEKTLSSNHFIPVSEAVLSFVDKLPQEKNIWIIGGNSLLGPLLSQDRIDKMFIQYAPVLLGDGIPLFTQTEGLKRFTLNEVNRYGQFAELVFEKK